MKITWYICIIFHKGHFLAGLDNISIESADVKQALETSQREIFTLKDRLQIAQDELRQTEANVSQLKRE